MIDTSQLNMHKSRLFQISKIKIKFNRSATTNRKLLQKELNRPSRREDNPRFDDRSNNCCCCCPSWVRVVVVGALTFSGATLSQFGNVMDCKICKTTYKFRYFNIKQTLSLIERGIELIPVRD